METISWTKSGYQVRRAVVELCRWITAKGTVTRMGERIAKSEWNQLSNSAREVLTRHGILE